MVKSSTQSRYQQLLENIFQSKYKKGILRIEFARDELVTTAAKLKIDLPKNLGDVIYSVRYRTSMPQSIEATQPKGMEWIIDGAGHAKYAFALVKLNRIVPNVNLATIGIPDATPEMIRAYALDDEQALLAIMRYNRLIDTFLGLTTYSLQNHLRTSVKDIGQIEIDELYFGLDRDGCHLCDSSSSKRWGRPNCGGSNQARYCVVQTKISENEMSRYFRTIFDR